MIARRRCRRPPAPLTFLLHPCTRYCEHNPDDRHNSCDIPQELTDAEIDMLQADNVGSAGLSATLASAAPPLAAQLHRSQGLTARPALPARRQGASRPQFAPQVPALAAAGKAAPAAAAAAAAAADVPDGVPRRPHKRPPVWQLVTSNLYTHRERKEQDEDDVMICQCKQIWATDTSTVGCGDGCLNRMLNIECVEVRQPA